MFRFLSIISLVLAALPAFGQEKERGRLGRFISDVILVRNDTIPSARVVDEERALRRWDGKTIGTIAFDRHDVFEDKGNRFRYIANGMHIRTLEGTVRRDLLFREGEPFDATAAVASSRILASRSYLSGAWLHVAPDPSDTTKVDITVCTLDRWTIGVDGERWSRWKRVMGSVYDANFMGTGSRVGLNSYYNYGKWHNGGFAGEYVNHNFLGSFYTAAVTAGRAFGDDRLEAGLHKAFILPTDYELGAAWADVEDSLFETYGAGGAEYVAVRVQRADVWGGKSWQLPRAGRRGGGAPSLYLTGRYSRAEFPARPATTGAAMNPLFHGRDELLIGAGHYRERSYTATMVYGYGSREYIATGHRVELVGGLSWREFGNRLYMGVDARRAEFMPWGYLMGSLSAGSYVSPRGGGLDRSVINAELFWFSNLWGRQNKMRQFLTLRYTQGWNMGAGAGALVEFGHKTRPVAFHAYAAGRTRLLLNTETVVFSLHRPLGFRLAVFGFGDVGLIGMDNNPFRNPFYSSFGIGIRIKNERLIFSALQLRLGFAVGREGFVKSQVFRVSYQPRIDTYRLIPSRPGVVGYE